MGIKTLWSVIGSAGQPVDLRALQGQTVAIDLAGWVVGSGSKSGASQHVMKPHLRNLFFRTAALLSLDIKPVFVLDGSAPELKKATLEARSQTQTKSLSRNRLKGLMNECAKLLETLGVAYVRAEGEAEAYAAQLNAQGLVDAVITDDSDAFCYGATTVLRNFALSGNSGEILTLSKLESCLNLNRRRMVFMAFALGCDFCPQGIPGLGKETLRNLFDLWPLEWDPVDVISMWHRQGFRNDLKADKKGQYLCSECSNERCCQDCRDWQRFVFKSTNDCHCRHLSGSSDHGDLLKLETTVKKRCKLVQEPEFWSEDLPKILEEFESDKVLAKSGKSRKKVSLSESDIQNIPTMCNLCPKVPSFISMAVTKLGWTEDYAIEKITPVLTHWHIKSPNVLDLVEPVSITKRRTVSGHPSFTIQWKPLADELQQIFPDSFETTEFASLVSTNFPQLVTAFEETTKKPKKRPLKKPAKANKPITQFFERVKEPPIPDQGTPISSSDLYKRIFLDSPDTTPVYPSKTRHFELNEDSLNTSEFVGDLSTVLDDILKQESKPPEASFEDSFDRMCL